MSVLIGHPTGTPFAYHAALAHFDAGRLEAFCVPWMPSAATLRVLECLPFARRHVRRLARRHFSPLAEAPIVQGRMQEWSRLFSRLTGIGASRLAHDANDWLMRTMQRECRRPAVTAVHAYEDCSLWQFEEAKRRRKACVYDMPIGYFPAWQRMRADLARRYADLLPGGRMPLADDAHLEQKRKEMELADIVLAPSQFVERTIREFYPGKSIALAPYGVDLEFWTPCAGSRPEKLRFVFAGQVSLRKGIPGLIEAWIKAGLRDAELELVGSWHLSDAVRRSLPAGIVYREPCDPATLRDRFRGADVVVFPSHFEGYGLALVEAMACGLPALASEASIAPELVTPACGRIVAAGDVEALAEGLAWFGARRGELPDMARAARAEAERYTWDRYRRLVTQALSAYA